jgi:hypothetical protein
VCAISGKFPFLLELYEDGVVHSGIVDSIVQEVTVLGSNGSESDSTGTFEAGL